jgi:hypothetical protein
MKVAVIGTAPGSRLIAPYQDESYEIWACSAGNSQGAALPRVTKWFELHALCDMLGAENRNWSIPYYGWLRAQSFPIYMQEKNDMVPQAIIFPYKMLCERFGPNPKKGLTNWFTSSIAWMMAFAITQMRAGDELAIFGVDMAAAEEAYTAQKAGIHRFIEYAKALGITVTIPYESCLGKPLPLYGYAEATMMGRKWMVRMHEMSQQRAQLDAQIHNLVQQRAFFDGALEGVKYDIRTWVDGMDAELDTDGKEALGSESMVEALKAKAQRLAPTTADFAENGNGVFVPMGSGSTPEQKPDPHEGSTVTVDAKGKKHYGMRAEPARIGSRAPANGGG